MSAQTKRRPISAQSGMVLVTALLLLIVVTLLAVGMFRSFGLDEKIAGNVREKQRALAAAETAEQYAEYWLASGNSTTGVACSATVAASVGQICTTAPPSVTSVVNGLWQNSSGASVGVTYTPTVQTAMNVTTAGGVGTYYYRPSTSPTWALRRTAWGSSIRSTRPASAAAPIRWPSWKAPISCRRARAVYLARNE
jgi:Tfp pilus assembly protein PilX